MSDNEIIYLKIPTKWNNTYNKLLYLVSLVGKDLITDCMCNCSNKCNSVFQCWNMFQSALAANELHEDKKAETLINFIDGELKILYRNYNIPIIKTTDNQEDTNPKPNPVVKYIYTGSNNTDNPKNVTLESLVKHNSNDVLNKTVDVLTTDDKPYVWFVSEIPLIFKQAGLDYDMYSTKIGNLYYYNTDALTSGDNKYAVYENK